MTRRVKLALLVLLAAIVGMGLYAFRLKRQAERLPLPAADTRPIAPPVTGPTEHVILYVADDNDGALHKQDATIALPTEPGQRARQILRALLANYLEKHSPHPLAAGADVNEVFLVKPNLAVVDSNAVFADGHRSGILVEELTVASIAQTLAANVPGVTRVKILVEGKERDTLAGHADISNFYDTAAGDPWPVAQ
jgi:hypothetical protein